MVAYVHTAYARLKAAAAGRKMTALGLILSVIGLFLWTPLTWIGIILTVWGIAVVAGASGRPPRQLSPTCKSKNHERCRPFPHSCQCPCHGTVIEVFLDTNIYDRLRDDDETRERLVRLWVQQRVRVIATPRVVDELLAGPFAGLPTWFPIATFVESVAVLDQWRRGQASLGDGKVFTAERGTSSSVKEDATVADWARAVAQITVSEDGHLRKQLAEENRAGSIMSYDEWRDWLSLEEGRSVASRAVSGVGGT